MKTYLLRIGSHEEGPYPEEQISQLFADGRADRNTPCRVAPEGPWRTIDDILPMLKYGTQLPAPSTSVVRSEEPAVYNYGSTPPQLPQASPRAEMRVSVVDFDIPFGSIVKLMFKWMAAALLVSLCFVPVIIFVIFIVMAIFGTLLGGMLNGVHHP